MISLSVKSFCLRIFFARLLLDVSMDRRAIIPLFPSLSISLSPYLLYLPALRRRLGAYYSCVCVCVAHALRPPPPLRLEVGNALCVNERSNQSIYAPPARRSFVSTYAPPAPPPPVYYNSFS